MRRIAATIGILVISLAAAGVCSTADMAADLAAIRVAEDVAEPKKEAATETGVSESEILPGNGSRAGYVLGRGNVIPESEWVYVGAMRAVRNKDYTIDYSSGTLFFTEPVRTSDSARVDYRYAEKAAGARSVSGGPGAMGFRLGNGLQMNMVYSYRTGDPKLGMNSPDILTYGANLSGSIGGSSKWSGMVYMSDPQTSNRMSLSQKGQAPSKKTPEPKKDRLMVQEADLGLGKVKLKLNYQDIGESFAGFQSMRESKVAPDEVLDMLEKEKGIRRMGIAGEVPSGASDAFNFSMGSITDKGGDIDSRSFGYTGESFKFGFSSREVAKGFTAFKGLREADRGQWAAEAGMKRTNFGLQVRTGMTSEDKPAWSALSMTELSGETGSLSYRSMDLDLGKVRVAADIRTMDPQFNRMTALNDEERTRMALIARRQFDPSAQASDVTAKDKAAVNTEVGLNRSNYIVQLDSSWLNLSTVESNKGDLERKAFHFGNDRFNVDYLHHSIDPDFERIASLQPVEQQRYGNETGMTRSQLATGFKFGSGSLGFSHANVTDHQGASVMRRSFDFASPKLKFKANFQDIDAEFSRIMDLSDSDRKLLVQERGFRRSEYALNFQATKQLNIDSYIYDSTNTTEGQTRGQSRHKFAYSPGRFGNISYLTDDYSYISETGNLSSYDRRKLTYDTKLNLLGGLQFKSLNDTNTTQEGDGEAVTTKISQYRLESGQKAANAFALDFLDIDYGDGRFESTRGIDLKRKLSGKFSFTGSYTITDRDVKDESNVGFGFEWAMRDNLAMSFKLANRDGGPKGSQRSHQFSMKGLLAKRFLLFDNVKVDSTANSTTLTGRQIGLDNGLRLEAGFLGGSVVFDNSDKLNPKNGIYYTSRLLQYESDKDPKKWYHLTFFRQHLVTPAGVPAIKRNYALDMRLSSQTNLTLTSYFGKDGQNGAVVPVGGTIFRVNHSLGAVTLLADYKRDRNDLTDRQAHVYGMGIAGTLSHSGSWEIYLGQAQIVEKMKSDSKTVFRLKYDHKIDPDHFITFTAERKSGVEQNSINPYEGDTTARLDFRTLFN